MVDMLLLLICAQCPISKVNERIYGWRCSQSVLAIGFTLTGYDIASITIRDQNQRV